MTEQVNTRKTSEIKQVSSSPGREQFELALQRALEAGPRAMSHQVRYILALSQMIGAQQVATPYEEHPIKAPQARLAALSNLAESLTEEQILGLVKDAAHITDVGVRLQMMTRLALHLPPTSYRDIVREVWSEVTKLKDGVLRARILFELAPLLSLVNDEPAAPSELLGVVSQAQSISNLEARLRSLIALAPHLPHAMSVRTFQRALDEVDQVNSDSQRSNALITMAPRLPEELKIRALTSAENIEDIHERAQALIVLTPHMPPELRTRLREEIVTTVSQITNEDERAQAMMAFIPQLEYATEDGDFPALLERALSVAVMITRRHIRARVLVALAPHLTLDLQGEALAAVHSLNSESDRALLLASLAPTLPPEMLVASLAVAHTMREQDSRVHALTILAHHVPENARAQTTLDALAAASNLPHHFERVTALVRLVDILPQHLYEQAMTNALETTRLVDNENARSRALNLLGPYLRDKLLLRAMEITAEFSDPQHRLHALVGITPYLTEKHQAHAHKELVRCGKETPLEYKQARTLTTIIPLLPLEHLEEVQTMVDGFSDPFDRVSVYVTLIQYLPPQQRPPILTKAWNLLKFIDDGYDQASALAAIAPFLPPSAKRDLSHMANVAISAILDEYDKASAISILAPLLSDERNADFVSLPDSYGALHLGFEAALGVPQQMLRAQLLERGVLLWLGIDDKQRTYQLWQEITGHLKTLPLADVLLCLGALMPLIERLVGRRGLEEIASILGVR